MEDSLWSNGVVQLGVLVGAVSMILGGAWHLITRWGDGRWLKRSKALGPDDQPLWATRKDVERYESLVTGQGDNVARHQAEIETLKTKVAPLTAVVDRMGLTNWDRIEEIPDRLDRIERCLEKITHKLEGQQGG